MWSSTHHLFYFNFKITFSSLGALSKRDKLTNLPTMSWKSRSQIAADIAEGMTFLHSRKPPLIHRDLKSPNVLLRSDGRAKISDFGLSKFTQVQQQKARRVSFETNISDDNGLMSTDMTGAAGTIKWMAPEVQLNANTRDNLTSKYGLAADVYSYGIVLFELVTCRAPWEEFGPFRSKIEIAVQAGKRPKVTDREKQDAGANDANILLDWMVLCWAQDPKDRPSFKQALRACRQIESVSIQYKKDLGGEEIKRSRSTRNTRLSSLLPLNDVEMSINGGSRYKPPIFNDDGDGSSERKELIIRRETEISQLSPSGVGGTDRERSSFDVNMISGEIYV
jgi:serine/threonine protein kinase